MPTRYSNGDIGHRAGYNKSMEMGPGVEKSELMTKCCQLIKYWCYLKPETSYLRGSEYRGPRTDL